MISVLYLVYNLCFCSLIHLKIAFFTSFRFHCMAFSIRMANSRMCVCVSCRVVTTAFHKVVSWFVLFSLALFLLLLRWMTVDMAMVVALLLFFSSSILVAFIADSGIFSMPVKSCSHCPRVNFWRCILKNLFSSLVSLHSFRYLFLFFFCLFVNVIMPDNVQANTYE